MHRSHLLEQLDGYGSRYPAERARVERFRSFVEERPDCFLRSCAPGHVTASAWIASADRKRFLLTHHKKLGRWLQLGGHADGEPEAYRVALREAQEESGIWDFAFAGDGPARFEPIDVDVHEIPANGRDPAHLHYDVRFVLIAPEHERARVNAESHELRWFPIHALEQVTREESLLRLGRKALEML